MNDVTKFNSQWLNPDAVKAVVVGAPSLGDATAQASDAFDALDSLTAEASNKVLDQQVVSFQQQNTVTKEIIGQNDSLRKQLQASTERAGELKRLPKIVTNVMGFFDKDFSVSAQEDAARSAAMSIDANNAALQGATSLLEMQQKLYGIQLQQIKTNAELGGNRISRALETRKQMQADEQQAFANRLAINQEMRAAESHTLSMAQARSQEQRAIAAEARANTIFEQGQEDRSYALKTDQELEAMAGSGDARAQKEVQSRQATDLALKQSAQAVASNDIQLANIKKSEALKTMNGTTLTSLAEKAAANGGTVEMQTDNGPVKFTAREISAALTDVQTAQDAATKQLGDRALQLSNVEYGSQAILEDVVTVGEALGGTAPTELSRGYKQYEHTVSTLLSLGDNKGASEATDAMLKKINDWKTNYVKSLPEGQRAFAEQRLNQMPANRESALSYMAGSVLSKPLGAPGSIQGNQFLTAGPDAKYAPFMEPIIAKFNEKLAEARGKGLQADPTSPLGFTEDKGSAAKISQMWQQAVAEAGPVAMKAFQGQRDITVMNYALQNFQKTDPRVFGGMSIQDFYRQETPKDGNGNPVPGAKPVPVFDASRALWMMRQAWERDKLSIENAVRETQAGAPPQQKPKVQVPAPYDEQFLQFLGRASTQQDMVNFWNGGLTMDGAAASNLIHNGAVLAGYPQTLDSIKSQWKEFHAQQIKKAQEQAQLTMELTKILRRQPTEEEVVNFMITGSPYEGQLPPNSTVGLMGNGY